MNAEYMNTDRISSANSREPRARLLHNWISYAGLLIAACGVFSFILLVIIDSVVHVSSPYIGILTYLVAPSFVAGGLVLVGLGALWQWRQFKTVAAPKLEVDLSRPRDRRILGLFVLGSFCFLLISAMGSYKTYEFSESVRFCGQACHTVMNPEFVAYNHGPHARVMCVECHVGPGPKGYVEAKMAGTHQLCAFALDKYERPIPTPVKNLRPARETCEHCHWPSKFVGNLDKTYNHFLGDETNTPYSVRLLLKVGGADAAHGPVGGIHWHMAVSNKVEYIATDAARQKIPWVRMTDPAGIVTVFRDKTFTNDPSAYEIRQMDCIDCHNRPAHRYEKPAESVNLAMATGKIDRGLPYIKSNAVYALSRPYRTELEAQDGIAKFLEGKYPNDARIRRAIPVVQKIYAENFFPVMKTDWTAHPDNLGHRTWPGCFRCHDGKHKTENGKRAIKAGDCNSCHVILAQGQDAELKKLSAEGQEFKHPEDLYDPSFQCTDCHSQDVGGGSSSK